MSRRHGRALMIHGSFRVTGVLFTDRLDKASRIGIQGTLLPAKKQALRHIRSTLVASCSLVLAGILFLAPLMRAQVSGADAYGGAKTVNCRSNTKWFHPEKIGQHWWLCTPAG